MPQPTLSFGRSALFDIPDDITYLNAASLSPIPRVVRDAGEQGLQRKLVGFRMLEKRDIARDHMDVLIDGKKAGHVTSGSPSTTCGFNLGLAYVPMSHVELGSRIQIEIRGKACDAEVVATPFYKRAK